VDAQEALIRQGKHNAIASVYQHTDTQKGRQACRQTNRHASRQTSGGGDRHTDRLTDIQAGRQAGRQAGGKAGRHRNKQQTGMVQLTWKNSEQKSEKPLTSVRRVLASTVGMCLSGIGPADQHFKIRSLTGCPY